MIDGFSLMGFVKGKCELLCLIDDLFYLGLVVIGFIGKGEFYLLLKFDNFCVVILDIVLFLFYMR